MASGVGGQFAYLFVHTCGGLVEEEDIIVGTAFVGVHVQTEYATVRDDIL